jgi:hypothetical protein
MLYLLLWRIGLVILAAWLCRLQDGKRRKTTKGFRFLNNQENLAFYLDWECRCAKSERAGGPKTASAMTGVSTTLLLLFAQ